MIRVLDLTKSTYCSSFARLCKEVAAATDEANDNQKFLATLKPLLERLDTPIAESAQFQARPS